MNVAAPTIAFSRHVPAIGAVQHLTAPAGATLADMAAMQQAHNGPLLAYVQDRPGYWIPAPREMWPYVRPKSGDVVRFYARLQGGGDGGQLLALVATIAIAAIAPGLGNIAATALLGFGHAVAGTAAFFALSAGISAGISIGGTYLLSRLFAGEPQGSAAGLQALPASQRASSIENIDADTNLLGRNSYLPKPFGKVRMSLPDLVHPRNYLDEGVPTIEKLLGAAGPVLIENVRIDGALADDIAAVTYETRDGADGTSTYTFVDKISRPVAVADELSNFTLNDRDLEDQETPANSAPIPIRFRTPLVDGMDEISFRVAISALVKTTSPSTDVRLPLRIRMRLEGEENWINWPEIHLKGIDQGSRLFDVRIRRNSSFGGGDIDSAITAEFFREAPEVTNWTLADGSSGAQWEAHAQFSSGMALQGTRNIFWRRQGLRAVLSAALFPAGAYEFEVSRGIVTDASSLNSDYEISGNVVSLFVAADESSTWRVPVSQNDYQTRIAIQQATVLAPVQPCQKPGTALIALKSRGQSVRNVTADLTGKAKDWGGAAFDTYVATSNPALQTRQLLEDFISHSQVAEHSRYPRIKALAQEILVNTDWTGWKAQCEAMGASCSLVSAGQSVAENLSRLLAAGLARPAFGPRLRIDYFRDRSAEQPAITFSPRNASIRMKYENPRRPMGMRAKFRNEDKDWAEDELEVRAPISGSTGNWQGVEIKAISDPDWLKQRLVFDQLRAFYWRTQYQVQSWLEGIACKPGTLVGIVTDLVDDRSHGARVREALSTQQLVLDQVIPATITDDDLDDAWAFDDLFEVGEQSFLQTTTPTGSEIKAIIDVETGARSMTVTLDSALSSTDLSGAHVSIGTLSSRVRRAIVVEDQPGEEFASSLICADETPIYQLMAEMFNWSTPA